MRIRVVVVVQLLSTKPDGDGQNVLALVFHFEISVADSVAYAVDDSSSPERDPDHLHPPNDRANEEAEEIYVDGEHHQDSNPVERGQQVSLEPVVGGALAVFVEDSGLANSLSIVEGPLQRDVPQAFHHRTVRI